MWLSAKTTLPGKLQPTHASLHCVCISVANASGATQHTAFTVRKWVCIFGYVSAVACLSWHVNTVTIAATATAHAAAIFPHLEGNICMFSVSACVCVPLSLLRLSHAVYLEVHYRLTLLSQLAKAVFRFGKKFFFPLFFFVAPLVLLELVVCVCFH